MYFYSRPCGRGDICHEYGAINHSYFYSRPCGRGDLGQILPSHSPTVLFLLTPLREGRRVYQDAKGNWH